MGWRDEPGPPPWRTNEERRGFSPGCRSNPDGSRYRADQGGHVSAFEGKGYTSPKTMRPDGTGDLTIRHAADPVSSGFEPFPRGDQSDLTLGSSSAAGPIKQELRNPVTTTDRRRSDSLGGPLRSLGRHVFGRLIFGR
jgi:hypothetical protein